MAERLAGAPCDCDRLRRSIRNGGPCEPPICFTPDRAFFAPAVRAIASMVEAEPDVEREIFVICAPDDVAPGFDKLPAPLRKRITLMTLDFSRFDASSPAKAAFPARCSAACFSTKSCPLILSGSPPSIPTC